jgi:ABC-type hemin transport system substrate-binding protein
MGPKVVSLVPCLTETAAALGLGPEQLVGRTDYCEEPADWIDRVPSVGGPKTPDLDAIFALAPDVVLVDEEENRLEDARALERAGTDLWVAGVRGPEDVPQRLASLGRRLDRPNRASILAGELRRRLDRPLPPSFGRVVTLVWWDPPMVVGPDRYGARLLVRLGLETPRLGDGPYPAVDLAALRAASADRVLLPDEPYVFSEAEAELLERELGPAADGERRVVRVDGRDLFWYGARTAAALERLGREAALRQR